MGFTVCGGFEGLGVRPITSHYYVVGATACQNVFILPTKRSGGGRGR